MYKTVILGRPEATTDLFIRTIRAKPKEFLREHVRRIYLTDAVTPEQARDVIKGCGRVRTLVCWPSTRESAGSKLLKPMSTSCKHIRKLSIRADAVWDDGIKQPNFVNLHPDLFARLTHLDLVNPRHLLNSNVKTWGLSGIYNLPKLKCLSLQNLDRHYHADYVLVIKDLLENCPNLRMVIVVSMSSLFWEDAIDDDRFAAVGKFNQDKRVADYWDDVKAGGRDFWENCEAILRTKIQRRLKLVEDSNE
jgi:hypothetical protein